MNVVFILAHELYRDRDPKVLLDMFTFYQNNSNNNVSIIWTDHRRNYNRKKISDSKPDIIIFGDIDTIRYGNSFDYVFNTGIHISLISTDFFYLDQCKNCQYIKRCKSLIHLGKCKSLTDKYEKEFPEKKIMSTKSRYVNTQRFKDYKLDKKYDLLIYGSRGDFYPLRVKLKNILTKLRKKYKVKIIGQTGGLEKMNVCNEKLSQIINQSYLTVATTGKIASIPFFKYNEISASNSFLLGDIPEDYRELYEGNIVEVTLEMSEEEIIKKIDEALKDKDKLIEKTNKFSEKIRKEHNLDEFTKDLDSIIRELLK